MVSLDQVEELDGKVKKAVGLIEALRAENARLFSENSRMAAELSDLQHMLNDLERKTSNLTDEQASVERKLLGAIDRLASVDEDGDMAGETLPGAPYDNKSYEDAATAEIIDADTVAAAQKEPDNSGLEIF